MYVCAYMHRYANELLLLSGHMCTLLYIYTVMQSILTIIMALERNANCLTVMQAIFVFRHSVLKVINIIFFMLCQQRYACICKSKQFILLQIWIHPKACVSGSFMHTQTFYCMPFIYTR